MSTQATQNTLPKKTEEHLDKIFRLLIMMAIMLAAIVVVGYLARSGLAPV